MEKLPRRDIVLLPLISMLTLLCMLAGAEVVTRIVWPEQIVNSCHVADPSVGFRYRPNCSSTMKAAEGPWYTNEYNACGYRSATPCGPVPAGTRRIALIGSSLSEGYLVEYPNTIAARLGTDLTTMCGAPVEVQNLGAVRYFGHRLQPIMEEALRLRPDAVLLVFAPFDLEDELAENADPVGNEPAVNRDSLQQRVFGLLKESRAVTIAQHFLFQNPSTYLPLYLRYGDKADFLRPPFTPNWQERLRLFDALVTQLADRAHSAGVPLTIAFVPQQAELTLMANRSIPAGVDPNALPAALAAIVTRHGATFVDTSVALRTLPKPERLYYQVDGHLSGDGQPIAAAYIGQRLSAEPTGPFSDCHRQLSTRLESQR